MTDFRIISGVYEIRNDLNLRIYIGQSKNIYSRWYSHIEELSKGKHVNRDLQNDFTFFGMRAFSLEVLEEREGDLLKLENEYIVKYLCNGVSLYNHMSGKSLRGIDKLY